MASENNSSNSPMSFVRPTYAEESLAATVSKLAFESIIALLGVMGNMLVCTVIAKRPDLKTPMYFYIFSLAVADLGVLLVNFPLAVVKSEDPFNWPFGETFCLYVYPVTDIFFGASIWSITVIAFERYRNIVKNPRIRQGKNSKRQVARVITALWIASFFVIALPVYLTTKYHPKYGCFGKWPHKWLKQAYNTSLVVFCYSLPLGIISYTYIAISKRLRASNRFLREMHGYQDGEESDECHRIKSNKRAQSILTPLVVFFALSMGPLNIFRLIMTFYRPFILWRYYWVSFTFCIIGVILNSASNPIIYTLVSKEFRNGIKSLYKSCQARRFSDVFGKLSQHQRRILRGVRPSFETSCTLIDANQDTAL